MRCFSAALVFFISCNAMADTGFSGYLKNFTVAQDKIENDLFHLDHLYRTQNSGRFMVDIFRGNQVWQLHYEVGVDISSGSQILAGSTQNRSSQNSSQNSLQNSLQNNDRQSYRLTDIRSLIGPDDQKNTIPQNLDRFNVQFQLVSGDLTIGRQAITFGSARIINPSDVFLPFDVRALNTEYRVGIDAIRFQKPLGRLGELDMGIILGTDGKQENGAIFLQMQTNLSGRDLQFTAMRFSEQQLFAAGIQSSLWDLGFWFETAYVRGDQNYNRTSIGVDYSFSKFNVFTMVEYHFNGAGSTDPGQYLIKQRDTAYQAGGVFLLGENYLIPTLSWQVSPLLGLAMQSIINLDDGSLFFSINADYSLSDNLYVGLNYYLFSGKDFQFSAAGQPEFGSEYGGNPNSVFFSLRYYF